MSATVLCEQCPIFFSEYPSCNLKYETIYDEHICEYVSNHCELIKIDYIDNGKQESFLPVIYNIPKD